MKQFRISAVTLLALALAAVASAQVVETKVNTVQGYDVYRGGVIAEHHVRTTLGEDVTLVAGAPGVMPATDGSANQCVKTNGAGVLSFAACPTSAGAVTSVSVVTANGVSGSVATSTTTPAITLTLGVLTPTSVNGITFATDSAGFHASGGTSSKTATFAGNFTTAHGDDLTLTTTASTNVSLPTTGTLATLAGTEALTGKTYNKITVTQPASGATLTIPDGITLNAGTGGTLGSNAFTSTAFLAQGAAPTISSGFGSSPAIDAGYASSFIVTIGTGGSATAGVVGLPTAAVGWVCQVENVDNPVPTTSITVASAYATNSVTLTNYTIATGVALAWTAGNHLRVSCFPH